MAIEIVSSDCVFMALEEIAATSGKAKDALVGEYLKSDIFKRVCCAALDPFITYGIKQVPEQETVDVGCIGEEDWELLDKLASRELTGNAAKEAIIAAINVMTPESAIVFQRIIKKDLRAGFSAKSVNRAQPGTIYTFECMLAQKFEGKRISFPVAVEPKYDGVRAIAVVRNGTAKFFSRTGKEFLNYAHIGVELVQLLRDNGISESWVFDGEMMGEDFLETVGAAHRKGEAATGTNYYVFESMAASEFFSDKPSAREHLQRRIDLDGLFSHSSVTLVKKTPSIQVSSEEEIFRVFLRILATGGEGVIVKPLNGRYVRKRSYDWLKIKDQLSVDAPIVGFFEGTGKFEGSLGGFTIKVDQTQVDVGSGLTDDLRSAIWADRDNYMGRMVEVQYHEKTPSGSLRHPRFIRFRDDKPVTDGLGV